MGKFSTKVRSFVRTYVPEGSSSLEDFEIAVDNTNSLREAMDGMLAKPTRKNEDEIHQCAYDFAAYQLDEYRISQRLIGSVMGALQSVIREHIDKMNKIEVVPLRDGAGPDSSGSVPYRRKGITDEQYELERSELLERARVSSKARKMILRNDIRPLRVVLARCKTLVKSLSLRAKSEFPSPVRRPGWSPDSPISDSSDPQNNPLVDSANDNIQLFADRVHKIFMDKLIQLETGKTQAKERAEQKKARKEQRAIELERTSDLMELRKKKRKKVTA